MDCKSKDIKIRYVIIEAWIAKGMILKVMIVKSRILKIRIVKSRILKIRYVIYESWIANE